MKALSLPVVLFATWSFGCGQASSADARDRFPRDLLLVPWSIAHPYFGAGASGVHHSGYFSSGTIKRDTEQWNAGAKAFVGLQISPVFSAEVAYHWLGKSLIKPGPWNEESDAIAAEFLGRFRFAHYPAWTLGTFGPEFGSKLRYISLFAKIGAVCKWIRQEMSPAQTVSDSGTTFLIGFGTEVEFPNGYFLRGEYDYIGKIGTGDVITV